MSDATFMIYAEIALLVSERSWAEWNDGRESILMVARKKRKKGGGAIEMQNVTLKVQGMSCGHCVHSVEKALERIGVSGKADLAAGTVHVRYDEAEVNLNAIREAIEEQGYDVV